MSANSDILERSRNNAQNSDIILSKIFIDRLDIIDSIDRARGRAERSFNRVYKDLEARKAARIEPRPVPMLAQILLNMMEEATPELVRAGNAQNKPKFAPRSIVNSEVRRVFRSSTLLHPDKDAA